MRLSTVVQQEGYFFKITYISKLKTQVSNTTTVVVCSSQKQETSSNMYYTCKPFQALVMKNAASVSTSTIDLNTNSLSQHQQQQKSIGHLRNGSVFQALAAGYAMLDSSVTRQPPAVSVDSNNLVSRSGPVFLGHIELGAHGIQRVALAHGRGRPVEDVVRQNAGRDGSTRKVGRKGHLEHGGVDSKRTTTEGHEVKPVSFVTECNRARK